MSEVFRLLGTPRFGGIATFMRMPHVPLEQADGIDIGIVGIPVYARLTRSAVLSVAQKEYILAGILIL